MLQLYHIQLLIIKLEGTIYIASGTTQLSQIHLNILQATEPFRLILRHPVTVPISLPLSFHSGHVVPSLLVAPG